MPSRGRGGVAGRDEHHRVAEPDDDGAVGLLGQLAGLDREGLAAEVSSRLNMANAPRVQSVNCGCGAGCAGRHQASLVGSVQRYLRIPRRLISSA